MNNENDNKQETGAGIFADTYKSIEKSEKIEPWSWEEGTFPPPREEDAPPEEEAAPADPEQMEPPPVIELHKPEEAAPATDPEEQEPDTLETIKNDLLSIAAGGNMASFMRLQFDGLAEKTAAQEGIRTGFENLDGYTEGIEPALYVVGAGTGLGKTTFCLQMADYIAASGKDVIYIALEQTPFELASKSISRLAAQISMKKSSGDGDIITSRKIRKKAISEEMRPIYEQAKARYIKEIAPHMNIIHFPFRSSATQIIEAVEAWRANKKTYTGADIWPVVFIDYLQVLDAPEDTPKNADRRRQVDDIMFSFKAYSEKVPVFVISSLNRSNYTARIDYEAFKESGNIEYTGEVIFGLQLKCINDEKMFDSTTETSAGQKRKKLQDEMEKDPREVELICLKNRYGARFGNRRRACFKYYPACDLFEVDYEHFIPHMKYHSGGGRPR